MACSLENTKRLAVDKGIIDKYNVLVNDNPETVQKFHKYNRDIKALGMKKFPDAIKEHNQPMRLDGKKVIFSKGFFDIIDNENSKKEVANVTEESMLDALNNYMRPDKQARTKYFSDTTVTTASSILDKIAKSGHQLAPLAEKLKRFAKESNATVVLKSVEGFKFGDGTANGVYNSGSHIIQMAEYANYPAGQMEAILLHEIIHSITYKKLKDNSEVTKDFQKLYEHAKANLADQYALTDMDEFMVALFTNSAFVKQLKTLAPVGGIKKYDNFFEQVMDWILGILKIGRTNSLYEQAVAVASNVMEEGREQVSALNESIVAEGVAYSKGSKSKTKTYGSYQLVGTMPFHEDTLEKIGTGQQTVTIRQRSYKDGIYTTNGKEYLILNLGRKNIVDFKDKQTLKESFKGDEYKAGEFKHIDDFFSGKQNLFVYQITEVTADNKENTVTVDPALDTKPGPIREPLKPAFEQQYAFFKRRLNKLSKELNKIPEGTDEYNVKKSEYDAVLERFNKATEDRDREEYVAMANEYLDTVDDLLKKTGELTIDEITDAKDVLNAFAEFDDVRDRVSKLRRAIHPHSIKNALAEVNRYDTSGTPKTEDDIDSQDKDVRWSSMTFGSLSDVVNLLARTIGSIIKAAQNRASALNKTVEGLVQAEVDLLSKYAEDNGMTLEEVYDLFIQESRGTLVLAQRIDQFGNANKNYDKIMNTPELERFYKFYQSVLEKAEANLPYKPGKFYILNKAKSDVKSDLKRIIPADDYLFENFVSNEELIADMVPDMFRNNLPADKKSRDLGSSLLQFAAYANNHNELSTALPKVRLLQDHLLYKMTSDGNLEKKTYINVANPKTRVNAEDSNIYDMVKTVIDMQIKGKMKKNNMTPIKMKEIKDVNGKVIGYKQIHVEDVIDAGLRWNSLLRIGLSPIGALANVTFGNISNVIEAIGGKHFGMSELAKANGIFFKQISYLPNADKDTNVYQWLNKLNPLQELADYELGDDLTASKKAITKEKAMELMYSMQKKGELQLQSTTMIALLIKEGYMNNDGTNTPKGDAITEEEATRLSDKIQRLNQMIHGRYSSREAATGSQSVWFRTATQFRKWIPAAIENRFGDYKEWDNRLQTETEGRYRTYVNKIFKADSIPQAFENLFLPLLSSKAALERGNMTPMEIYNMRKNMIELILLLATVLMYAWLKGGDDDEDKKKLRNPYVKAGLTVLNRVSGDLLFFYNPSNIANIASNAAPMSKLIKDVIKVGWTLPHAFYLGDYKIKRGSLKGNNDFWSHNLPLVLPGLAPAVTIQKIVSDDILPEL